ncbi:hypothetical protein N7455_010611 [Penicillium solitum]|uniref:uncharacterized protein n=1 Tax=Penicillium solitum TaxID=60172 RepID=UPI0032C4AB92|nr:hypothetical protein N7536_008324 [Penicillium majusculum]KAJ5850755.1 hypothetical protein N7455_010611 [Penicillium solitum]
MCAFYSHIINHQLSTITLSGPILDALQSIESGVILGENILLPKSTAHVVLLADNVDAHIKYHSASCAEYNRHSARGGEPPLAVETVPRLAWAQLMESQHTSHIFPSQNNSWFCISARLGFHITKPSISRSTVSLGMPRASPSPACYRPAWSFPSLKSV